LLPGKSFRIDEVDQVYRHAELLLKELYSDEPSRPGEVACTAELLHGLDPSGECPEATFELATWGSTVPTSTGPGKDAPVSGSAMSAQHAGLIAANIAKPVTTKSQPTKGNRIPKRSHKLADGSRRLK
jgi:hypothetical protein